MNIVEAVHGVVEEDDPEIKEVTFVARGGSRDTLGGWGKGNTMSEALKVAKSHGRGTDKDYQIDLVLAPNTDKIYCDGFFTMYFPTGSQIVRIQDARKRK